MVDKSHRKTAGKDAGAAWERRADMARPDAGRALRALPALRRFADCAGNAARLRRPDRFDHVAADVAEFADGHVFQAFAPLVELLVDLDGRFLHHGVGFLAPADSRKFLPRVSRVCPSSLSNASPSRAADLRASLAALTEV